VRLILLGAPDLERNDGRMESWHVDVDQGARELGWDVEFMRVRDVPADDIVRAAKGADMLLWLRTHSHNPLDDRSMLARIQDAGTVTCGLHLDLYWGIAQREKKIGNESWWKAQHVFTADGGDRNWASRGVNHHWCPPPFGSRHLGYGKADPSVDARAVFVGSCLRSIHGDHRFRLIAWARRTWGSRFLHVGRNGHNRLYHQKLNHLYASVGLVLGDSAPAGRYWSDRIPRTLGRGGLLAYPRTPGLDEQGFTDDVMIRYDRGQFGQILDRYRELSPAERRAMTDAGLELVRSRHLWRHRLAWIAEVAGCA